MRWGCGSCSAPTYEYAKNSVSRSAATSPPAASLFGGTSIARDLLSAVSARRLPSRFGRSFAPVDGTGAATGRAEDGEGPPRAAAGRQLFPASAREPTREHARVYHWCDRTRERRP